MQATNLKFIEFEKLCSQDEISCLKNLHSAFYNPNYKLQNARDLHLIYSQTIKIIQSISQNAEAKHQFIEILQSANGKLISRLGLPKVSLDFSPIIEATNQEREITCKSLEIINSEDPIKVIEAAEAIDQLSYEGVGRTFGVSIYKKMIESNSHSCLLAKNEQNQILGCLFGTLVELKEPSLRIFHFWICARKATYPGIHLIKKFEENLNSFINFHNPDYFSLTVDHDNHTAIELYCNAGFINIEKTYNNFSKKEAFFMVKKITNNEKELPHQAEVTEAITQLSLQTLGYFSALVSQIKFIAKGILFGLLYK